jgi:hypothetical protein
VATKVLHHRVHAQTMLNGSTITPYVFVEIQSILLTPKTET